ncbi:recombinase RecT [Leuconostoc pseudomesenteroides]|uniref:recombinase RecT n=1 Tax=Leuconostoc pseudomesenteroides TaxID=33968 RepID=UPI003B0076E4
MANETALVKQLSSDKVVEQFVATAGAGAKSFAKEVALTISGNPALEHAKLGTVIVEATKASALGLSLLPTVGEAYLVPYKGDAQFQLGYKGIVQLAMRSGQMKSFGAENVYAGENPKWDKYNQELVTDGNEAGDVVGYYAFFTLVNGFKMAAYWPKEKVEAHRDRFSKSKKGPWSTDFDAMAKKTVLKSILQFAPKSSEMKRAFAEDTQAEYVQAGIYDVTPDAPSIETAAKDLAATRQSQSPKQSDDSSHEAENLFDELSDLDKKSTPNPFAENLGGTSHD